MTIPLPNPLSTTETVLIGLLLLFFALWGWRHGLDAAIIWGLFVIAAAWAAPELAAPLGKIFNAVVAYQEKSIEFNKRFINPWIRLGNVFDKQDRNRDAVAAYQKAIEIDPGNAQNWCDLGSAYFRTESYEQAIHAFKKAIELNPTLG